MSSSALLRGEIHSFAQILREVRDSENAMAYLVGSEHGLRCQRDRGSHPHSSLYELHLSVNYLLSEPRFPRLPNRDNDTLLKGLGRD